MILLHRLYAHNFKQLTDVSLRFPESGTVLIEGSNEAGKSSLFEAVFFALYGRALLAERDYQLTDLRHYGADALHVELDFSISGRPFSLTRRVGKSHTAKLICPLFTTGGSAGETETITSRSEIRKRLGEELSLSADALLNTCFVEQKRLERLEDLDANARRATINELLNLRVLTDLESEFKVARADYDALQLWRGRVEVARLDAELPILEASVESAWRALRLAQLQQNKVRSDELDAQIEQAQHRQESVQARRTEIEGSLREVDALRARLKAIETDLSLRAHAWQAAVSTHEQAVARVQELQQLAAALPERERQWQVGQERLKELKALEQLEAEAARLRDDLQSKQEQLAHHDQLRQDWEQGRTRQTEVDKERQQWAIQLEGAEAQLHRRRQSRERSGALALLMQHLAAHDRALREVAELEQQINTARAKAARLPQLCARLQHLESAASLLRQRDDNHRARTHLENELAAAQRRQADAGLGVDKLADLDTQQAQAQQAVETAVLHTRQVTRKFVFGITLFVVGVLTTLGSLSSSLEVNLTLVAGLIIWSYGANLAWRGRNALHAVRQEQAQAMSTRSALEGERRAMEASSQSQATIQKQLSDRVAELSAEHARLSLSIKETEDWPPELREWHDETLDTLKHAQQTMQHEIAVCTAAATAVDDLQQKQESTAHHAQQEADAARTLALGLKLHGDEPQAWHAAALAERGVFEQETLLSPDTLLQSSVEEAQQKVAELERQRITLESEQQRRQAQLEEKPHSELMANLTVLEQALSENVMCQTVLQPVRASLETEGFPPVASSLATQLAHMHGQLERDRQQITQLPFIEEDAAGCAAAAANKSEEFLRSWAPVLPHEPVPTTPTAALAQFPNIRSATEQLLTELDELRLRSEDRALQQEYSDLGQRMATWRHQRHECSTRRGELLAEIGVDAEETLENIIAQSSEFAEAHEYEPQVWSQTLHERQEAVRDNRSHRQARAQALSIATETLNLAGEESALAEAEQRLAVRRRAGEIVQQTRRSIVSRVMPLTMQNMRQLLPLLTEGRYQDVQWDEESNYLAVYDNQARDFVRKRVFSGGARDQISLALRLAFALATLPGEHNIRPGWLFLDEPLSSFDRPRTQALVDLLTRGLVRRQFAQIFLVSHSESFDPSQFDFRLRMEAGRVAESTLPDVILPAAQQGG